MANAQTFTAAQGIARELETCENRNQMRRAIRMACIAIGEEELFRIVPKANDGENKRRD